MELAEVEEDYPDKSLPFDKNLGTLIQDVFSKRNSVIRLAPFEDRAKIYRSVMNMFEGCALPVLLTL